MSPHGPGDLLIDDVTVVDGVDAEGREGHSVLIVGGRIEHVGPPTARTVSWSGPRVAGAGRWLVPGLIDLHIHTTDLADMACYLANGITTVRFAGVDSRSVADLRARIALEGCPAPSILTCGPMLDTDPPSWPAWARIVRDPADARRVAAELLRVERPDALFAVHGLTPELVRSIVEVADEHARPVVGQLWQTDARQAAEIGVRQLDNTSRVLETERLSVDELTRARPMSERLTVLAQAWVGIDWPRTEAMMDAMVGHGVAYGPSMMIWQYLADGGNDAIDSDPDLETFFSPDARATFAGLTNRMTASWSPSDRDAWRAANETRREWLRRFHSLGGDVVLGTDMQFGGIAAHAELAVLVESGLTPLEALATATSTAARVAGCASVGRVAADRRGDLLLLAADPRLDVRHLRRIDLVVQDGVPHDPASLRSGRSDA
jgi:hypothetical protein